MPRLTPDEIVALSDFLATPDPPDLPPRGHHVTCEGRPDREVLLIPLITKATQWRYIDREWEPAVTRARAPRASWVQ